MSFETLRITAATLNSDEAENQYDGPDIPAHLDEASPLQPWDADYTHCVFFDPDRFPTDAQRDELLEGVRRRFPAHLRWRPDPVSVETLHGRMHIYCAYHARHFEEHGYVPEIEPPQFGKGHQARSIRSERAWHAFLVYAVIAEAIIDACRKLPADRRQNLVFVDATADALIPICGAANEADGRLGGRNVLCRVEGLLVAPRTFNQERTLFPALSVTRRSAITPGAAHLASFYSPPGRADRRRDTIRRRADLEVRAWSDFLAERFSPDGLVLWYTQNLALLRIQATDWAFRERPPYVKSGTQQFAGDPDARATKKDFAAEEFEQMVNDLRVPRDFVAPKILRPFLSVRDDVRSILAGGIGLEDEAIWQDDDALRHAYSPQLLEIVAAWISELRRMRPVTLTGPIASLIQEIVTGELDDLNELTDNDGQAALLLVRRQFPNAIWRQILDIAINAPDHINALEVRYRWNDNPTDPIVLERDGDAIVIVGPMIDLRAHNHAFWTRRAEMFRDRGSLTI
jgi:hypothetical protein